MASTSGIEEAQPNTDQELLGIVNETKRHIKTTERKVQGLKALTDKAREEVREKIQEIQEGREIDESVVSDIEELSNKHDLLKKAFFGLLEEHFITSAEGECLGLKLALSRDKERVFGLKTKIRSLKDEEQNLKWKLDLFSEIQEFNIDIESTSSHQTTGSGWSLGSASGIDPPQGNEMLSTGFALSGESSVYSSTRNFDDYRDWKPRLLAKKLRIIKYYYLRQSDIIGENRFSSSSSINSGLQNKFGWLRSTKNDDDLDVHKQDGSEFKTLDIDEMKWQIWELVRERRNEKAEARKQGKRSLLEYVRNDGDVREFSTLNLMNRKVRGIVDSLSCHVSDMFYVAVETGEAFHKFKDHLRGVLKWLDEKGKTPVIRRVLVVLQDVEEDLFLRRKIQLFPPLSEVSHKASPAQQQEMDRLIDTFLRESLRLESILSYPNLSEEFLSTTSVELKTFKKILDECEKVVAQIGQEMQCLKTIHCFVSEKYEEGSIMKSFENGRATLVGKAWGELTEG